MILVAAALEEELYTLRKYLTLVARPKPVHDRVTAAFQKLETKSQAFAFEIYELRGTELGLLVGGVGKVAAAAATATVCALHDVSHVLRVGCVLGVDTIGGGERRIAFGDVVTIVSALEHDVDYGKFIKDRPLIEASRERHSLYAAACVAAQEYTREKAIRFYDEGTVLTGDAYINASKPFPKRLHALRDELLRSHFCVVVDMETAAIFRSVQQHSNADFAALGIVLDSVKEKRSIRFSEDIMVISHGIYRIVSRIITHIAPY